MAIGTSELNTVDVINARLPFLDVKTVIKWSERDFIQWRYLTYQKSGRLTHIIRQCSSVDEAMATRREEFK